MVAEAAREATPVLPIRVELVAVPAAVEAKPAA
jgi:hypothetical protein